MYSPYKNVRVGKIPEINKRTAYVYQVLQGTITQLENMNLDCDHVSTNLGSDQKYTFPTAIRTVQCSIFSSPFQVHPRPSILSLTVAVLLLQQRKADFASNCMYVLTRKLFHDSLFPSVFQFPGAMKGSLFSCLRQYCKQQIAKISDIRYLQYEHDNPI